MFLEFTRDWSALSIHQICLVVHSRALLRIRNARTKAEEYFSKLREKVPNLTAPILRSLPTPLAQPQT